LDYILSPNSFEEVEVLAVEEVVLEPVVGEVEVKQVAGEVEAEPVAVDVGLKHIVEMVAV